MLVHAGRNAQIRLRARNAEVRLSQRDTDSSACSPALVNPYGARTIETKLDKEAVGLADFRKNGCDDCVLTSLRTTRGQRPPAGALAKTERDMSMDITCLLYTSDLPTILLV